MERGATTGGIPVIPAPRQGQGLRRGSLTPELIVAESLRLLDEHGLAGFSLPKLGRALGANPTAVYRHFADKDDLILAIADLLLEEAGRGLAERDCWVETVTEASRRLRTTYRAHPAAASLSSYRTTRRPAELRAVNILIGAVHQAGFEGSEAALVYRAIGEFALSWAGAEAAFLALDLALQRADRASWTKEYLAVDQAEYPHIWRIREELPRVDDTDIFETALTMFMTGLAAIAPRPCACPRHPRPPRESEPRA